MKKWTRVVMIVAAIGVGLVWGGHKVSQKEQTTQRAKFFIDVMNSVSEDWAVATLESHMVPVALAGSKTEYSAMLKKASGLGKFVECNPLNMGEFKREAFSKEPFSHFNVRSAYSAQGVCVFEEGKAYTLVGYLERSEDQELVLLVIDNVQLNRT